MKFVFALIASALISSAAYAGDPIKVGDKYSGHVPLHIKGGKDQQVPLPDGEWLVTATHRLPLWNSDTELSSIYMANVVDGKLSATVKFVYPIENHNTGWKVPRFCSKRSLNYRHIGASYNYAHTDCWGVTFIGGAFGPEPAGARSVEYLKNVGVKMPIAMTYVQFNRADDAEYLIIGYAFNPELEGVSPPENTGSFRDVDYHPTRIRNYPKKKAFMERTIEWGKAWKSKVDAGFKGKLKAN